MFRILLALACSAVAGPSDSAAPDRWGFGFHPIVGYDDQAWSS